MSQQAIAKIPPSVLSAALQDSVGLFFHPESASFAEDSSRLLREILADDTRRSLFFSSLDKFWMASESVPYPMQPGPLVLLEDSPKFTDGLDMVEPTGAQAEPAAIVPPKLSVFSGEGFAGAEPKLGADSRSGRGGILDSQSNRSSLVPFRYKWAWQYYLASCANHWMPEEIDMSRDAAEWADAKALSQVGRNIVKANLGLFSRNDLLAESNISLGLYRHIIAPECRQFLLRQAFEGAIHVHSNQFIVEKLALDQDQVSADFQIMPSVRNKSTFLSPLLAVLQDPGFSAGTVGANRELLKALIAYSFFAKGLFVHGGVVQVLALGRLGKMQGVAEHYQCILRDVVMHREFGVKLVNQIRTENRYLWTAKLEFEVQDLLRKALDLEVAYAEEVMSAGIGGVSISQYKEFLQFLANQWVGQIGLSGMFPESRNPFSWLDDSIFFESKSGVFEARTVKYRSRESSLEWGESSLAENSKSHIAPKGGKQIKTDRFSFSEILGYVRQLEAGVSIAELSLQSGISHAALNEWHWKYAEVSRGATGLLSELLTENEWLRRQVEEAFERRNQ